MPEKHVIFISYRRSDSKDLVGRIYDFLSSHFGSEVVFKDVDSIPLGVDFRIYLADTVGQCRVLIAVIGPTWLDVLNARLGKTDIDWVRAEIETALGRGIPVIPLLIGEARLPREAELPEEMKSLAHRNATTARPDPDFKPDMERLIQELERILGGSQHFDSKSSSATSKLSRSQRLELDRLRSELEDQERDYKTVEKQLRLELDGPTQNRLRDRLAAIADEMDDLEQKIQGIEQGNEG